MTDLAAENAALKIRIKDLEFMVSELKGEAKFDEGVRLELRRQFGLTPKGARIALLLSDGNSWSHDRLIYALDLQNALCVLPVHVCIVRRSGFKIKNIYGLGFAMSNDSCERVRDVILEMA